jgi:hypothetical protein
MAINLVIPGSFVGIAAGGMTTVLSLLEQLQAQKMAGRAAARISDVLDFIVTVS